MVILEIFEATYKTLLFCVGYATGSDMQAQEHN